MKAIKEILTLFDRKSSSCGSSCRKCINLSIVLCVNYLFFVAVETSTGLFTYLSQMIWILQVISYSLLFKFKLFVIITSVNELVLGMIHVGDFIVFAKLYQNNKFYSSDNFTLRCRKLIFQSPHRSMFSFRCTLQISNSSLCRNS
jgi:hypothetical protein